ncbi:TIGR04104 family putative zinc finger protein [Bacillus massiliigorillae]|uniref:TIGR04104 family putative zinc finger protein n=1 Tax=Bacillus massiliigorillae TaxID=1243664 RepID=UPI00039A86B1|nr:TIGR04104 family putative zinc finger protein [Bacillus massiliigorillae]
MPTCQNCHFKWSWVTTFKRMFTFKAGIICPHCQHTQYVTTKARNRTSLIGMSPLFSLVPLSLFNPSISIKLTIEVLLFIIAILIVPLFYKLSNKEEPLF